MELKLNPLQTQILQTWAAKWKMPAKQSLIKLFCIMANLQGEDIRFFTKLIVSRFEYGVNRDFCNALMVLHSTLSTLLKNAGYL